MGITKIDILDFISTLPIMDVAELIKEFETQFGVSAKVSSPDIFIKYEKPLGSPPFGRTIKSHSNIIKLNKKRKI